MNYTDALKELKKVGSSRAGGDAALAMFCQLTPSIVGPGVNPEAIYDGAKYREVTYDQIRKMNNKELEELMWVGLRGKALEELVALDQELGLQ